MITGTHALIHSDRAEEIRAFFRDILRFPTSTQATAGSSSASRPPRSACTRPRGGATTSFTCSATTSIPPSPISKSAV
jgi:hypothetical protein